MEQSNNRQTELFWELLDNPADKSYSHVQNLRQLVNEYPQSGLLRALLLYAGEDDSLNNAVVYTDPRLLYKLRNDADGLHAITDAQLIKASAGGNYFHTAGVVTAPEVVIALPETFDEVPAVPHDEAKSQPEQVSEERHQAEHFFEPEKAEPHAFTAWLDEEPLTVEDELVTDVNAPKDDVVEEHAAATLEEAVKEEETIPLPEHTLTSYEGEQQAAEIKPEPHIEQEIPVEDIKHEPEPEQQIPVEDIKPKPQFEQEIELPTPGFFVPEITTPNTGNYEGGDDMYSKLYESYAETFEHKTPVAFQPIDDEVYDEIVSIEDINLASPELTRPKEDEPAPQQPVTKTEEPVLDVPAPPPAAEEEPVLAEQTPPPAVKEEPVAKNRKVDLNDEAEKLMLSNIAATDFFVFDHALSERIKAGDEPMEEVVPETVTASAPALETELTTNNEVKPAPAKKNTYERVTKYFDDKMPYSFMWWLDKTRKEHSGIYQPFVEFKLDTSQQIEKDVPDELQQQYYENIFELTSVNELERATGDEPVKFDPRRKEDEIIERFIHEVPQIKPQTGEKLDNENKAKRSSEDQDEIVTETLAQVYVDQMLYHKAIKVYKKLILKFPEKRRYFAGQIEQLEKKIS